MTATASISIRTTVAGVTISQSITRNEEVESHASIALPAGKAGTLTTRTDDNTGVATVATGHGITTSDKVSVFWTGGSRYNVTVTATTSTTISIDSGSGDNLPLATTALVVTKEVTAAIDVDGDKIVAIATKTTQRSSVEFKTAVPASVVRYDMAANEGRFYVEGVDMTNDLAGEVIASVVAANGTTTDATLDIGLLLNAD